MIKVCYIIVNCKRTGPMNQTLNIIHNMDRSIFEISVITLFPEEEHNSMLNDYINEGVTHICLGLNRVSSLIIGKKRTKMALDTLKPNVVHGLGMPPYRMGLGYRDARHIVTLRNYMYDDYPSHYNRFIGPILAFFDMNLVKKQLAKSEIIVTCSESLTNIYKEKQGIDIPFIRNGVNIDNYPLKKQEGLILLRDKLKIPQNKIVFIYTGGFIDRKDQESAIIGFLNAKCNDESVLILCGDGTNFEVISEKYCKYNNIIFTGKVDNMSEYLCASDIYVTSSKSEGLPNGVLEAMASGLALILSDIPQHMELLQMGEGLGVSYHLGNNAQLSDKFDYMFNADYASMGMQCYYTITRQLTSSIMSERYQELYKKMVE